MAIEIERKFLVNNSSFKKEARHSFRIVQGFINKDPERAVRVRLLEDKGKLTIKGLSSEDGLSRFEWETPLSKQEAEELMNLCEPGVIEKLRYEIPAGDLLFEVDEFFGDNAGLLIAEIELPSTDAAFPKPSWLGAEVTGDKRYYNSYLSEHPYKEWA